MGTPVIEKHPFTPFIPVGSKVMMCGTFPPKRDKWAMDFFYPNYYNDMWRIFGLIFYKDKEHFFDPKTKTIDKAGIKQMLSIHKIGVGETATEVIRTKDNASDKFLEIVTPVNLSKLLLKASECIAIVTTGEKAASIIASLTNSEIPKMGEEVNCQVTMDDGDIRHFKHIRMPSTSRAYPMPLEKKADFYCGMLKSIGILK